MLSSFLHRIITGTTVQFRFSLSKKTEIKTRHYDSWENVFNGGTQNNMGSQIDSPLGSCELSDFFIFFNISEQEAMKNVAHFYKTQH